MNLKNKILLALSSLLLLPQKVWADNTDDILNGVINVNQNQDATMTGVADTLKTVLGFARGAGIIICVIMLVYVAVQLAASAGNQQKRAIAMEGIKNVLIAVAIIGGATLIASLAYGVLK